MNGTIELKGNAPAGSAVEVLDSDGNIVANCQADDDGQWMIPSVEMPVGEHRLHAIATCHRGRIRASQPIDISIEAGEADDPDLAAEMYRMALEDAVNGRIIDYEEAAHVIELAGKDALDFLADVEDLIESQ